MSDISLFEAARLLLTYDDYLILIHEHSDGDAVGSGEALRLVLQGLGKKAKLYSPDENLRQELDELLHAPRATSIEPGQTLISVDVAESALLGKEGESLRDRVLLKLDHHRTGKDFARHNYTDPGAAAAGEIVFDLAELLGVRSAEIDEALYAAIASDTGCFCYSNTTARTHEIAAKLLLSGVDAAKLNTALFESKELQTVRATAYGVEHTEFLLDGQAALVCLSNAARAENAFLDEHFGELAGTLRAIRGVEFVAVIRQDGKNPEKYRLSTRSKSFFDCAAFCAHFEGGGHLRAAGGGFCAQSPEEALQRVKEVLLQSWKN